LPPFYYRGNMLDPSTIDADDFKDHFFRDFTYTDDEITPTGVCDADITKAFSEALANFNPSLFGDDATLLIAFLYLTAHYLCTDLQAAAQGANSTGIFPEVSKTVGSVSVTYHIPLWLTHDPVMSAFATTRYGMKYISIVRPLLVGGVAVFQGATTP
jgi:hypothetical protein